jgi:hypothetical protein
MLPSMLCHLQAIPSISSYSASPFLHSFRKKPASTHFRKYACTLLELPKSFGRAFHWMPVRSTNMMAQKTLRLSIGLRPAPLRRWYVLSSLRFGFGMSGLTLSQNLSDTSHDLILLSAICQYPMILKLPSP